MVQFGTFGAPLQGVMGTIGMPGITMPRILHMALAEPGGLVNMLDAYASVPGKLAGFSGQYQAGDGYSAAALFNHLLRGATPTDKPDIFSRCSGCLNLPPGRVPSPSAPVDVNGAFFWELELSVASEIPVNDRDGSEALFASRGARNYVIDMAVFEADLAKRAKYVLLRSVESGAKLLIYSDPRCGGHQAFVATSRLCWPEEKEFLGAGFMAIRSGVLYFDGASNALPTYDEEVSDPEHSIERCRYVRIAPDVGLNAVESAFKAAFPSYAISKVPEVPKDKGEE